LEPIVGWSVTPSPRSVTWAAASGHMNATAVSSIASSMCWPAPVRSRLNSAAVTACAAVYAVSLSQRSWRLSCGTRDCGSPCTSARPEYAWMMLSYTRLPA
jgi:hypothetical protein